jgi:tetratricopeptide (TPR) repeat protein
MPKQGTVPDRRVDRTSLRPVTLPDLSRMEPSVQRQMRDMYSFLTTRIENPTTAPAELGDAYGEMGSLLMAAEYVEAAEPCYVNAHALMPNELRWPYFLGHVARMKGDPSKAAELFEQALKLAPTDVAALVWLGDMYLELGRPEAAEPLFVRALSIQPPAVAALFGQGRAALARREYSRAVELFERALSIDRRASVIHYPLALAYRGLGDVQQAEAHLRQRGDTEIGPPDPLLQALPGLLQSAVAYENQGIRALNAGDWATATDLFRKGLELAPDSASLHHKLGTALSLAGDANGAMDQFLEAVRRSPGFSQAHYSLGVLLAASGKYPEAIDRFTSAVKFDPSYTPARLQLAEALRRTGRPDLSLIQYAEVYKVEPSSADAQLGHALALIQMRRYDEARAQLSAGMKRHPDRPQFAQMLERLKAITGGR